MNWEEKTEKLKKRFDNRKKYRMKCDNCGNIEYSKQIWSWIEEVIDMHEKNNSEHLIHQLENAKELFYIQCPDCGGGQYVPK